MDNEQFRPNDILDLSLQGTAIHPGTSSSRPSSARRNSQTKQPPTPTPSREGSAKERRPSITTSINFSSARQRRHSNSSQQSIGITSPRTNMKKSTAASPSSSSLFRVISPPQQDADGFFTDQSQRKSDDSEWEDTRRWVDELHQLNSSFIPQQPTRDVGSMGMSRDSLNGTIAGNNIYQSNDHRNELPLPTIGSISAEQVTPTEEEKASMKIQRWYRKNNTRTKQTHSGQAPPMAQEKSAASKRTPVASPRIIQQQDTNNSGSRVHSRRPSSASSTSKQRRTPIPSSRPPSARDDLVKATSASSISSTASSTSTLTSKVTLDDVYESLRKLEEVEQFPTQPQSEDDSVYLLDPTATMTPLLYIDELPPQFPDQYDLIVNSVRSQKSTTRERSSPIPTRFGTPPQSARRQQPIKVIQSMAVPNSRPSSSIDQQTRKATTPSKSWTVGAHVPSPRSTIDADRDFDYQLQIQQIEYEAAIQRHLKFIDQLIDDKKKLSSRCELLVSELKTIDRKCNDRIRAIEESHRHEIQQMKDVHESAEKIRRERWIEDKTRKIKELTVRGLEPEIQKLISKHKNEITKLKTVHEAELLAADERASQRYIRMVEELRDQLEREKEEAIARERELARGKYEKAIRDEEQSFNEQRRRLYTEIEEEKTRQAELATRQRADLDKLRRDIEENHRTVSDSTKREYEGIRLEQERRHTNEINELKERLTIDQRNWEENYMKNQEMILANKERELREQMKQERDKEIEKIIAQLESDTTSTKEEVERTADNRVKRTRDKYEAELRELENSERETKEKYNQTKAQLLEFQGEHERSQILLKQKESEINDIKKITDTLQQERERLSDIIREEFADRLVLTDDENHRVKNDIAELRARQQLELEKKKVEFEQLEKKQEKELETIHEKIKQAITKKDEQVQGLRVQYETAMKRADHLQSLLAQQRKIVSTRPTSGSNASKKAQPS